jgi:hypothetical protein
MESNGLRCLSIETLSPWVIPLRRDNASGAKPPIEVDLNRFPEPAMPGLHEAESDASPEGFAHAARGHISVTAPTGLRIGYQMGSDGKYCGSLMSFEPYELESIGPLGIGAME